MEWVANGDLLHSPENSTQYSVIIYVGKESEKEWTFAFFFFFLWLHPRHMEVPRLGVASELQLPTIATAIQDLSCICDLTPQLMATLDP